MTEPVIFYKQRIGTLQSQAAMLKKRHRIFAWLRLLLAVVEVLLVYKLWADQKMLLLFLTFLTISCFLWMVAKAVNTQAAINQVQRIIQINQQELKVLKGDYFAFPSKPAWFEPFETINNDLDLFGHASLFQFLNRSNNHFAQQFLASAFCTVPSKQDLQQKQEAVRELSAIDNITWCQQLQSFSMDSAITHESVNSLREWINDDSDLLKGAGWQVLRIGVPIVSFTLLALFISNFISSGAFWTTIILILTFVFAFFKKLNAPYIGVSKQLPSLQALLPALHCIETAPHESELLVQLKQSVSQPTPASVSVKSLKSILQRLEYRLNPVVYIPLCAFLFWDLQQVLALQRWKKEHSALMRQWLETTGYYEMLASLAVVRFNNPSWTFPDITDDCFHLECRDGGHPLLANKAVTNSFSQSGPPSVALITGSNMAGKSTFLRTIGANMILGMTGSAVYALYFKMPMARILSSMRIADNLEEGTSTFYAELKKIKTIVDATNASDKVYILIDEMLRGTNTLDRHTGSVALVKQLLHHRAVAMIATHDVSLATLDSEFAGQITNYHFDSTIEQEEIVFDYRLKPGVCKSTNASLLMKKIGIEL